jgi:hypothetical protein
MDIGGIEVIETGSRLLMAEDVAELTEYIEQLESENAKLRSMRDTWQENDAKLRELVRDMWHDGMCECDERGACAECEYHFPDRMRELGIEVSDGRV